ncbi:bile acid:sodium symporter family protein [Pseudorhizobium flavum]|uniref:bile acid:sodium symporter family protein n=1 Tax=Pseudorhizobium flavum TaxID=1335061 RepID=UPI0037707336
MKLKIDPFLALMMGTIVIASIAPAHGAFAKLIEQIGTLAVAFLFFAHGAVLPRRALIDGLRNWKFHLFVFAVTFGLFPLIVQPLNMVPATWMPPELLLGFLYLAALPSAVSSSIAFTSIAKGNVPAAVCNSAASNVFGLMLTPLLVTLLMRTDASGSIDLVESLEDIVVELLLPFGLGQALHTSLLRFTMRYKHRLEQYDQGVIIVIIYAAFSKSVVDGLWSELSATTLFLAIGMTCALLMIVISFMIATTHALRFSREDRIAAVFCGSKKSLASGLPLAQVLFAGSPAFAMIVLPIMLYNQIQIIVGAIMARRYSNQLESVPH